MHKARVVDRIDLGGVHREVYQFLCPGCGVWGDIDEDQYHGRVSIHHDEPDCGFHETLDLSDRAVASLSVKTREA